MAKKKSKVNKRLSLFNIVIGLLAILVLFMSFYASQNRHIGKEPPSPSSNLGSWMTYKNVMYKFSIKYPREWTLKTDSNGTINIYSVNDESKIDYGNNVMTIYNEDLQNNLGESKGGIDMPIGNKIEVNKVAGIYHEKVEESSISGYKAAVFKIINPTSKENQTKILKIQLPNNILRFDFTSNPTTEKVVSTLIFNH